jgi:hypothetical protein
MFSDKLELNFPNSLPIEEYFQQTLQQLKPYGFVNENTLGVVATCRDEIAEPLLNKTEEYWGKTFDLRSLGGFLTAGKTGISTVLGHTPIVDGMGRFVIYAMPHIAISGEGEIGNVYREGIQKISHACGSLSGVVHELASGHINCQTEIDDLEQSMVRQKIISAIHYGEKPNLLDITKLTCKIISDDLKYFLDSIDSSSYNYAVFTGILIHGPKDTHWVHRQNSYVVNTNFPAGIKLDLEKP